VQAISPLPLDLWDQTAAPGAAWSLGRNRSEESVRFEPQPALRRRSQLCRLRVRRGRTIRLSAAFLVYAALLAQDRGVRPITVERKQALIIANWEYPREPLKNPANDAVAMEAALRRLGFEVRTLRNLDLRHMEEAVDDFSSRLTSGSFGFFYFAGHGMQVDYTNYLLPVDFAATSEADVRWTAYPATRLQEKLEGSGARLRVLVLDACRNNRFRYKRDARSGLAAMSVSAEGTLIAFATGDNNTADDNPAESNGLYTKYLVQALLTPGLQLREAFQKAKEDVYLASRKAQNPSIYENVVGYYYLVAPPPAPRPIVVPPATAADVETWEAVRDSSDPDLLRQFLNQFPQSQYALAARAKLAALTKSTVPQPSVPAMPEQRPVATKVNTRDGLTYVWIPPGTFVMGCSPWDDECYNDEKPSHQVAISGFWMGQTPVTQQAYERVAGMNPSYFKGPDLPVERVSWYQAQSYCQAIGGRLPTEAEWEYAARAGSTARRYGSVNEIAWYSENSGNQTHAVGQKQPNAFSLYDMLGNVWQWTTDWYEADYYKRSENHDPVGPPGGQDRARRGGSSYDPPRSVRASFRGKDYPGGAVNNIGFRCVGN